MAYHDDLLQQAFELIHRDPRKPKQASLRRAVSAAYYTVFHLLITEAVANWKQPSMRAALGRAFDHSTMKAASNRLQNTRQFPFVGEDPRKVANLRDFATTFSKLQEERHIADYDNGKRWSTSEALKQVQAAEHAFRLWESIRKERIAQAYLVSLMVKKRD